MATEKTIREQLHETALKAPQSSGVYLWRNAENTILYVGKAKNLKNRLSSYFSGQKDIKTRILISRATSIEYIVTSNEYEALILENNLIKQHNPRFNIDLKDGKTYPVLRITNEKFPRVFKTRYIIKDGSQYFGPYPNVNALDTFLEMVKAKYPLRQCKILKKRDNPCLYYHIGKCSAPCCEKISKESYMEFIEEITHFLEVNPQENLKILEDEMKEAAKKLDFEKAARLRDGINAVKVLLMKNLVSDFDPNSRDYIGYATEGSLVSFAVLKMRNGKLESRDLFRTLSLKDDDEIMSEFFPAFYTEKELVPANIFVPPKTDVKLLRQWLKETFDIRPKITLVGKSEKIENRHRASFEMANHNAKEDIIRRLRERGDIPALKELQQLLDLPALPLRIEGFDIAHLHGKYPVASLISFYNGNPDKKNYRYFRLKTTDGIIDDFASMKEATTRRYTRLLNEKADLPDLIMIDGGIGQVNAVKEVLSALDLDIPLVGLAEKNEELYFPGNSTPLVLPRRSDALRLLQRVRDETHRFATTQNQKLRSKENVVSRFEKLPNIGKKRAKLIYKTWKTLSAFEAVCKSAPEEVSETLAMPLSKVEEARLGAKILLQEAAEKQQTAKAAGVTGMVRPHSKEDSFTEELARQALQSDGGGHRGKASSPEKAGAAQQGGGGHSGQASSLEEAGTAQQGGGGHSEKGISPEKSGAANPAHSSAAKNAKNVPETSYLSSLAASALEDTLEVAESEQKY